MFIAITQYKHLTTNDIVHYKEIMDIYNYLILRTPMQSSDLQQWIEQAIHFGLDKEKLCIHNDIILLERCNLKSIHFSDMHQDSFQYKAKHPNKIVSMSTHSDSSVAYAESQGFDYVLFGHIFSTSSKPNQPPRTLTEIQSALKYDIDVVALGGINSSSLQHLPKGFSGIAGISLFSLSTKKQLERLIEEWRAYV